MDNHSADENDPPAIKPVAYRFRFTFSDQTNEHDYIEDKSRTSKWLFIAKKIKSEIFEKYSGDKVTGGIEYLNKLGEYTNAHFHCHFYSVSTRDTIAKQLRRILEQIFDQDTKGIKRFYLTADVAREDAKFWRYPLKQGLNESLCSGFSKEKLEQMHTVAAESWQTVVQISQAKADKRDNSDTLFERALCEIKKKNLKTKKEITTEFISFYVVEKRPVNRQTITGYVLLYMLLENLISPDALASEWLD